MSWIVLTCTPQTEFASRDALHRIGLAALVPVEFRMRQAAKVKSFTRRPVLPGYVFASRDCLDQWPDVRRIDGLRLPLRIDGRCAMLTPVQVSALELLSQPAEQRQTGHSYRIGDRIRIRRGAMAELEAVIASLDGGRFVAAVELFGKQHHVKIDPEHVEAA